MEMLNNNINDLLTFGVLFVLYEIVGKKSDKAELRLTQ